MMMITRFASLKMMLVMTMPVGTVLMLLHNVRKLELS